jgi:ankyrin repeat protein
MLLSHGGLDPSVGDFKGRGPLHKAVRRNYLDIMKFFREQRSPPNIRDKAQYTPLHYAVTRKPETLQMLLTFTGIDVNARNKDGDTALHLAALKGCVATSRILLATPGVNPQLRAVLSGCIRVEFHLVACDGETLFSHFEQSTGC